MSDILFYAFKNKKWIKRKTLKSPLLSELYDTISELNEKFNIQHWSIPAEINPSDFPQLLQMEEIMNKHLKHYKNDFYLHDTYSYLSGDQKGIWLLRESGTHYIPLGEHFTGDSWPIYNDYIGCNKHYYFIDKANIKKINQDKVYQLIEERMNDQSIA